MNTEVAVNAKPRAPLKGESGEGAQARSQVVVQTAVADETQTPRRASRRPRRVQLTAGGMIEHKYRLIQRIGTGGMGEVWEARHDALSRTVAIKVPLAGPGSEQSSVQRFLMESRLIGRTKHPGIVDAFDFGYLPDGRPFAVFEFLTGEPLDCYLHKAGKLSVAQTVFIVDQVCAALAHVHAQGVIHRDLKPSNIFLHYPEGDRAQVKLLDFGLGKSLIETDEFPSLTGCGQVVGTPSYMSYEQARGERDVDVRTDIWNVGLLLYELLTGVRAFERADICSTLASVVSESPLPLQHWGAQVPQKLSDVIFRCLHWERDERYQSMQELREALADATRDPNSVDEDSACSGVDLLDPSYQGATSVAPCAQNIRGPSTIEAFQALGLATPHPWLGTVFVLAVLLTVVTGTAYRWANSVRNMAVAADGPNTPTFQPIQAFPALRPTASSPTISSSLVNSAHVPSAPSTLPPSTDAPSEPSASAPSADLPSEPSASAPSTSASAPTDRLADSRPAPKRARPPSRRPSPISPAKFVPSGI